MILEANAPAWAQQHNESSDRYELFIAYRDMGPTRALRRLAPMVNRKQDTLLRHSRAHGWVERCAAWDQHIQSHADAAALKITEHNVEAVNTRHLKVTRSFQRFMTVELARHMHAAGADLENPDITRPPTLSMNELRRGLDWALSMERVSMGMQPGAVPRTEKDKQEIEGAQIEFFEAKASEALRRRRELATTQMLNEDPDALGQAPADIDEGPTLSIEEARAGMEAAAIVGDDQ